MRLRARPGDCLPGITGIGSRVAAEARTESCAYVVKAGSNTVSVDSYRHGDALAIFGRKHLETRGVTPLRSGQCLVALLSLDPPHSDVN
jgi:hypothetical protein